MLRLLLTTCLIAAPAAAFAQDAAAPRVGITADRASVTVETADGPVEIMRDQTEGATLDPEWAVVNRDCPPFCIQPHEAAPGTTTIGEIELLDALEAGEAILVDSRDADWYATGTIPGAINIPYLQAVEQLGQLGCEPDFDGKFNCTDAQPVILFCNGLWCAQSPTAIRAMIDAGFPAEKISYYRGGMQVWRLLGLTVAGGGGPMPVDAPGGAGAAVDPAVNATADPNAVENPVAEGTTQEASQTEEAPVVDDQDRPGDAAMSPEPTSGSPADAEAAPQPAADPNAIENPVAEGTSEEAAQTEVAPEVEEGEGPEAGASTDPLQEAAEAAAADAVEAAESAGAEVTERLQEAEDSLDAMTEEGGAEPAEGETPPAAGN